MTHRYDVRHNKNGRNHCQKSIYWNWFFGRKITFIFNSDFIQCLVNVKSSHTRWKKCEKRHKNGLIIMALCSKIKKSAILRSNLKKSSDEGRSAEKNIQKKYWFYHSIYDFIHWSYLGIWYCPILFRALCREEGMAFYKINQM